MTAGDHGAAGSALGYAYQGRLALLELIKMAPLRPDASISLELHDDVAWDEEGTPSELLQIKHHMTGTGGLGDMHPDIWKTINAWMDHGCPTDQHGPRLVLVSNSVAPEDSAAANLRNDDRRDVVGAEAQFVLAAETSESVATEKARARFLALAPPERQIFVSRIQVVDQATPIQDIDAALKVELWHVLPKDHEDLFLALLWRWWDKQVLDQLRGDRGPVAAGELRLHLDWVRDGFSQDSLPTLVELADVNEAAALEAYENRLFVAQLNWVRYPLRNVQRAIIDFHRAVTQTTAWLAGDLIGLSELLKFESNLRDEWGRAFDDVVDALGSGATDEEKIAAGKQLLRDLLESTAVSVRAKYNDPFFARGKRHELAEQAHIGWHPDFHSLVAAVIAEAS